jgi:hypothetical protein
MDKAEAFHADTYSTGVNTMAAYQCLNCEKIDHGDDPCCDNPDLFCINDMPAEIKRLRVIEGSAVEWVIEWLRRQRNETPATGEELANALKWELNESDHTRTNR